MAFRYNTNYSSFIIAQHILNTSSFFLIHLLEIFTFTEILTMSKRELKKYLSTLNKEHLEEQLIDLYDRFKEVKTYYDFVFNPREDKLLEECKIKISNEYFPIKRKKAKARRSVAQNYIRHFMTLGVDPSLIADVMLFNIEIAQAFAVQKDRLPESFFKSMLKSFEQAVDYIIDEALVNSYKVRINKIVHESYEQDWLNKHLFKARLTSVFQ